jgi:hypothetical protein
MVSHLISWMREMMDMILGYNKNPFQYTWIKLFNTLVWLFIFLISLATVIKALTEQ